MSDKSGRVPLADLSIKSKRLVRLMLIKYWCISDSNLFCGLRYTCYRHTSAIYEQFRKLFSHFSRIAEVQFRTYSAVHTKTLQGRSDFHLVGPVKKHLGKRFNTEGTVQQAVMMWLWGLDADFFYAGIDVLVYRWNKCLDKPGDYVEKQCTPVPCYCVSVYGSFSRNSSLLELKNGNN
ncbi:hypothetical protein ANN_27064 [Periplaneta americana]|uniref:Uncharacterized protein n=1 Tax=Periplaneta americana TaxID=6978 RepID=A0ABQ8RWZ2_PERAM|nr:hypothetical protein ANN_27064 [Periplaneta americana]